MDNLGRFLKLTHSAADTARIILSLCPLAFVGLAPCEAGKRNGNRQLEWVSHCSRVDIWIREEELNSACVLIAVCVRRGPRENVDGMVGDAMSE